MVPQALIQATISHWEERGGFFFHPGVASWGSCPTLLYGQLTTTKKY